ncbi:MAG: DUF2075 domain-containing protein, partial [Streptomyces sp.]|nr:DUF2075 domain-containing protein [Streptomyces sp.]
MEGNSVEPGLFEAALPLLRELLGREVARTDATDSDSAARELVRQVLRWAGRRGEVDLAETELARVVEALTEAVWVLAEWGVPDIRAWGAGPGALADLLLTRTRPALSPEQARLVLRLLRAVCELALAFARGVDTLDAEYERRYREYVAAMHDRTEILGVPVQGRVVPLHQTYVPAMVRPCEGDAPVARPLEQVVEEKPRLLVRGEAGAGKTTALQWLALRTARVPYLLRVRSLARADRLPGPAEFLSATGCPLPVPRDWTPRILAEGRALVMVDGVDEIPERERARVRGWLYDLCAAYPHSHWIVTCRPSAVRSGWLAELGFHEEEIAPFSDTDVDTFVTRRYRSGRPQDSRSVEELLALPRARADLMSLARNPLLCSVLYTLHEERGGRLPRTRTELYRTLLDMLLGRRDAARGIGRLRGEELSPDEQAVFLGDLAYWLARNGRSEMSYEQALHIIDTSRQRMPQVSGRQEVLTRLLERSGVLRSPAEGTIDFLHRSFQDFLAAMSLVENGDFGLLGLHVEQDSWRDVFLCAVGLARRADGEALLRIVLGLGDAARERATALRYHLLAAAGLAEAVAVEPQVHEAVRSRVAGHLPPRTPDEVDAFAAVGPTIVTLLPAPDQVRPGETGFFLDLLARVPGPEGEAIARRLAPPGRRPALRALPEPAPGARQLAVALSIATRIEPELIRAVRLRVFPLLDAGDEADLWFSPWTAARTPQAMALRTELLPVLRAELAAQLAASAPTDPIWTLGSVVEEVHTHVSPALGIEERLNWLDVTHALTGGGDSSLSDALLLPALRALVEERREGIADWLAGAWPRLPEAVRESKLAWQLVTAALHRVPDVGLEHRPAPPGVTADDVAVLVDVVGDATLTVSRSGDALTLGAGAATPRDEAIVVPDTDPRVVEVLGGGADGFRTVTVPAGAERSVRVGSGRVRLRTPRGEVYELEPAVPTGSEDVGASDGTADLGDAPGGRRVGEGPFLIRTSAAVLARTVAEVAADVWRAECLKYPKEPPGRARPSELRSDYAALAKVLLEAGLGDVDVLLGEVGGPGDEPADVTLVGRDAETCEHLFCVCVELRNWSFARIDPVEPRVIQFEEVGRGVHPLARAQARMAHLARTHEALGGTRRPRVDHLAYLHAAFLADQRNGRAHGPRLFDADAQTRLAEFLRSRLTSEAGQGAADALLSGARRRLPGDPESVLIDERPLLDRQVFAAGRVMEAVHRRRKRVVVVTGAAGTGKTTLALKLFTEGPESGNPTVYVTGHRAFRHSLRSALGPGPVIVPPNNFADDPTAAQRTSRQHFPLLIFDDSQCLRATSTGRTTSRTDRPQVEELLDAADVSVFVLDEESTLRRGDVGTVALISATAEARGLPVEVVTLRTPLRFGGGTAYPRWVDAVLAPDEDARPWIPDGRHTVLSAAGPEEMDAFLRERREEGGTARMVAGFCWPSPPSPQRGSVRVGEWQRPWQSRIPRSGDEEEVGTVYHVQGYEFDWCGVLLGPDLVHRDGRWITVRGANLDPALRPKATPNHLIDRLIRNAYRVLLTRSRTGVVLFSTDPET